MPYKVTKPKSKQSVSLNRSTSSSFSGFVQRKPAQQATKRVEDDDGEYDEPLEDHGLVNILATDLSLRDVVQAIHYIRAHMFDDVPIERSGMNSTRTAEVLNFRRNLPPMVTNLHVHALIDSPTMVEKEIGQLVTAGVVRRIVIPGRGVGASSISDGLVLVKEWVAKVEENPELELAVKGLLIAASQRYETCAADVSKEKYISLLTCHPRHVTSITATFTEQEITSLLRAGYLTTTHTPAQSLTLPTTPKALGTAGTLTSLTSIARAASAASGGPTALHSAGGGTGAPRALCSGAPASRAGLVLTPTLPGTGAFLRLVQTARAHLLAQLARSKGGRTEAPVYLLRERWDGGLGTKVPYGRGRDPFRKVLPGRTRKWKEFWGLSFDWVLAECLGARVVECFETGSVGLGVRAA